MKLTRRQHKEIIEGIATYCRKKFRETKSKYGILVLDTGKHEDTDLGILMRPLKQKLLHRQGFKIDPGTRYILSDFHKNINPEFPLAVVFRNHKIEGGITGKYEHTKEDIAKATEHVYRFLAFGEWPTADGTIESSEAKPCGEDAEKINE
jgi:hypothetical protein